MIERFQSAFYSFPEALIATSSILLAISCSFLSRASFNSLILLCNVLISLSLSAFAISTQLYLKEYSTAAKINMSTNAHPIQVKNSTLEVSNSLKQATAKQAIDISESVILTPITNLVIKDGLISSGLFVFITLNFKLVVSLYWFCNSLLLKDKLDKYTYKHSEECKL